MDERSCATPSSNTQASNNGVIYKQHTNVQTGRSTLPSVKPLCRSCMSEDEITIWDISSGTHWGRIHEQSINSSLSEHLPYSSTTNISRYKGADDYWQELEHPHSNTRTAADSFSKQSSSSSLSDIVPNDTQPGPLEKAPKTATSTIFPSLQSLLADIIQELRLDADTMPNAVANSGTHSPSST